jgi:ATP-dependent DNA helicase RecQ
MGIPAYRVLTNATIERIAEAWPTSAEQLESISGIGPATIEQFGFDIIELVRQHVPPDKGATSGATDEEPAELISNPARETSDAALEPRATSLPNEDRVAIWEASDAYWTWRLFSDGYSARQIERIRCRDRDSLADDLALAVEAGQSIDPSWIPSTGAASLARHSIRSSVIGG